MRISLCRLIGGLVLLVATSALATVRYVDVNSATPTAPYTNWATAATTIQDAIDAGVAGDQILVTNGIYSVGGRLVYGSLTNRVALTKPLTVQSVNGPDLTVIRGYQVPGATNGDEAVRCVYLTNGASLIGFTLTSGATRDAGDLGTEQAGGAAWCESINAVLSNCILTANASGRYGGGCFQGTLDSCVVAGNWTVGAGGGASSGTLNNCTITNNGAANYGGGADGCTLSNCMIIGNVSFTWSGGGVHGSTLRNCSLIANTNASTGGGAGFSTLNNCLLRLNSGPYGGGAYASTLSNCTVVANSAVNMGGGIYQSTAYNCIVYFNTAPLNGPNHSGSSVLNFCCSTELPGGGVGNISSNPDLADTSHLSVNSPCRGAGSSVYSSGVDIDGESWSNPPSIGCDEYIPGTLTGPLTVAILAARTNVVAGWPLAFAADITGRLTSSHWNFGDGTIVSNQLEVSHAWLTDGDYPVTLTAYNETYPGGVSTNITVHVAMTIHYVAQNNSTPAAPYDSWATAATNIQDAIDSAIPGDEVVVGDGVYRYGGKAIYGTLTNRIAVPFPVAVYSVNGPAATIIEGFQVPGATNADGAIRCVYLTNGASLSGFTLTNGATLISGDNRHQYGGGVWCESTSIVVSNCIMIGNSAYGAGGGIYRGDVRNCIITENRLPTGSGGGAYGSLLNNCAIYGNSAANGGGAQASTLKNCTVTGNVANQGPGVNFCSAGNTIIYYNDAPGSPNSNYFSGTYDHCCTTPLAPGGSGNFTNEPQLATWYQLGTNSPCRGAGIPVYATGLDIDGDPWLSPPSIGCDEYNQSTIDGPLELLVFATPTIVAPGLPVRFTTKISGHASALVWDFADGILLTNHPAPTHIWAATGEYQVVVHAYNNTYPGGINATSIISVIQPIHYVSLASTTPVAPYSSWATAATNIQDAVDVATFPAAIVLVTNGVYQNGGLKIGALTNRVMVLNPIRVRSVNGPEVTIIQGYQAPGTTNGNSAVRCVYLTNGASLAGFTLTNGATRAAISLTNQIAGGGVFCSSANESVSNCVIVLNAAFNGGGGAYSGTIRNSVITRNTSSSFGGGAYQAVLHNCLLTYNQAVEGGGASQCVLHNSTIVTNAAVTLSARAGGVSSCEATNCIVYYNTSAFAQTNSRLGHLSYCCVIPAPTGIGIITNAPVFVDLAANNFRLATNSPCINAGTNSDVSSVTDLDDNPRIRAGLVDIGTYEVQSPLSSLPHPWLLQYGLPINSSVDQTDSDSDGMSNWQEWQAATSPINAASVLWLYPPATNSVGLNITWKSVDGITYLLQRSTNLQTQPPFSNLKSNLTGLPSTTTYSDTNAVGAGPYFYRVGVQ